MRKSGLQKQIAFIFNDVPMPEQDPKSLSLPIQQQDDADSAAYTPQTAPAGQTQSAHTKTAPQVQAVHTPVISNLRPKPLPRMQVNAAHKATKSGVLARQVKKTLYGTESRSMDPRQKKMTILVGVLAIVFAGVMTLTLGGMGEKKSRTNKTEVSEAAPIETLQVQQLKQWQIPEPLPEQMRDPMNPQKAQPETTQQPVQQNGQMTVRGIVFSQANPSAIINDQIIREGGTIDGITVVKINKDSVEFEQGGKRWTQPVQR